MLLFQLLVGMVHNHVLCSACRWMVISHEVARGRDLVRMVQRRTGSRVVDASWSMYRCTTSCDRAASQVVYDGSLCRTDAHQNQERVHDVTCGTDDEVTGPSYNAQGRSHRARLSSWFLDDPRIPRSTKVKTH